MNMTDKILYVLDFISDQLPHLFFISLMVIMMYFVSTHQYLMYYENSSQLILFIFLVIFIFWMFVE